MSIKDVWKKVTKTFSGALPPGCMNASDVQYIDQKVREETNFSVACMDTRMIDVRKNVGLVMPVSTPAEEVIKAEDVFISAAKDRGIVIDRKDIPHYAPGTISKPDRNIKP